MAMIVGMQYRPVLDLDFGRMKSLTAVVGPTPSFTRASTGTYFNSSGVLTTAAINGPRFDHVYNGVSWVSRGLLIEEARTNSCTYSSNQLNAAWTVYNATVTASSETDPAGGTSAFRVAETTTSDQRHIVYNIIPISASTLTYSVYAKAQERIWLQLISYDSPNSFISWFNLSTGVVGTNTAGNTSTITSVGNGWYRCSVTKTSASTQYIQIGTANGDNNGAYAGDPTKGLLIYGAQVETGAFPTSYIPTTSTQLTRSADVCQITGSDFSGFYNQSEGSFAVEFDRPMAGSIAGDSMIYIAAGSGAPSNIQNGAYIITSGNITAYGYISAHTYNFDHGSQLANTIYKIATGIRANDFASSLNGAAVLTDNSGTVGTNERLLIGYLDWTTGVRLNGHIARLRYYNTRLPNAILRFFSGGSGAFQPDNISGLQFWVDASDTTTLYTDSALTTLAINDNDVIGGWKDKSGNSRNALQNDGAKKPLLKLAIQNGRNVVRYDGVNDFSLISTISIVQPYHVFFVTKIRSTGDIFHANGQAQIRTGTAGSVSPLTGVTVYCGTALAGTNFFVNNTVLAGQFVANGTSSKIYKDGLLAVSGDPGTQGITSAMTLASYNDGSANLDCDFMEFLIYASELSATNRQLVEAYLKAKWGTP